VSVYSGLADVPPFNPDLDTEAAPIGVVRFRAALDSCDAMLICSPDVRERCVGRAEDDVGARR
jgi:NAD(P)H-dependent FMN reductase